MRTIVLAAVVGLSLVARTAEAAPSVWVIDDGEKIGRSDVDTPFEQGKDNPVWSPGQPVRLSSLRNESVAMQVVVEADDALLEGVAVDLGVLNGPDGAFLAEARVTSQVWRPIERFVEHFVSQVPDALIPVEHTPSWAPYPLVVQPRSNGIVWIDLNVPRDQAAGSYRGEIRVRTQDFPLAGIPVELQVADAMLPDRTVGATAGYVKEPVRERAGPRSERQLWQLLRAHRIAPMHDAVKPEDVTRQSEAIDGSLYLRSKGYLGPGPGLGDGALAIGAHGAFGVPDQATLAQVQAVATAASAAHAFGGGDVILVVDDERCSSPAGNAWKTLFADAPAESLRRVRLAWTCTQDPTAQPVDVPILRASWNPAQVAEARAQGKTVWVYGGELPRTGSFALDADAVSPRVNGWLQAMYGIPRWLVPDIARWGDADDPAALGLFRAGIAGSDGSDMLVYPGTELEPLQRDGGSGPPVLPSIRLKNWRRGIQDAGYLQLARERDPVRADAVARWLIPAAFGEVGAGREPSWGARGKPFADARGALLAIALGRPPATLQARAPVAATAAAAAPGGGCTRGAGETGLGATLLLVVATAVAGARRRGRVASTCSPASPPAAG